MPRFDGTNIVKANKRRDRFNTIVHNGTPSVTTATFSIPIGGQPAGKDSVLLLCPIKYSAALIEVLMCASGGEYGQGGLGIYGISPSGTVGPGNAISSNICGNINVVEEDTITDLLHTNNWGKSIHSLLHYEDGDGDIRPLPAFLPYIRDNYGMLALTGMNDNTITPGTTLNFRIQYINITLSDSTLLKGYIR